MIGRVGRKDFSAEQISSPTVGWLRTSALSSAVSGPGLSRMAAGTESFLGKASQPAIQRRLCGSSIYAGWVAARLPAGQPPGRLRKCADF